MWRSEKEGAFHSTNKSFCRTSEGRFRQRWFRKSANQLFWDEDQSDLPPSLVGFVQIFPDKAAASLKCSVPVAYPMHVALLNFSQEYKKRLFKCWHSLVAFFFVGTEKSEGAREVDIWCLKISIWIFHVLDLGCCRINTDQLWSRGERLEDTYFEPAYVHGCTCSGMNMYGGISCSVKEQYETERFPYSCVLLF